MRRPLWPSAMRRWTAWCWKPRQSCCFPPRQPVWPCSRWVAMAAASCSRTRMWTCCCYSNPRSWPWTRRTPSRPSPPLVGFRSACQPLRADARRVHRGSRPQHRAEHQPARPALPHRDRALYAGVAESCRASSRATAGRWCATWRNWRAPATRSTRARSITWSRT